jgi:hypothetical protein
MALSAIIRLTTAGNDTGPFNLYSNVDNYVTAFESSILKTSLVSGFTTNNIPNNTSIVRLKSIGFCTNYIDLNFNLNAPTSTPTPTPTSTGSTPTPTPTSTGPTPTPTPTPTSSSSNKCSYGLGWNNPSQTCSGSISTITVSVNGNNGEAVEFSTNNGVTYSPATTSPNIYVYNTNLIGTSIPFTARIVGCNNNIYGSVTSCGVATTPTPTPTATSTGPTPTPTPTSTGPTPTPTPTSTGPTPTPTPTSTPVSNLTERKSVYIGYPNLYTSNDDVYDRILNKFSNATNEINSVYTSNGFNSGSNVYRTSSGTLFGTGYLAYFVGNTLKKVKVTNGVISEIESNVTVSPVINPSTTKILAPFKHFNSGAGNTGYGYALYQDNGDFFYWMSKLEIAADGLTISDSAWGNSTGTSKYWKFNKELVSTTPLSTPYRIPEIYKGTVVEIQIVVLNTNSPDSQNSFSYSLLIAK